MKWILVKVAGKPVTEIFLANKMKKTTISSIIAATAVMLMLTAGCNKKVTDEKTASTEMIGKQTADTVEINESDSVSADSSIFSKESEKKTTGAQKGNGKKTVSSSTSGEQKIDTVNVTEDNGLVGGDFDPINESDKKPDSEKETSKPETKDDNSKKEESKSDTSKNEESKNDTSKGEESKEDKDTDQKKETMDGWTPWR